MNRHCKIIIAIAISICGVALDYNVRAQEPEDTSILELNQLMASAESLRKAGDFASAIETYNKAIQLDPNCELAFTSKADCEFLTGNYEAAVSTYTSALVKWPTHTKLFEWRANTRMYQGDLDGALADANSAVTLEGDDAACHRTRARILLLLGKSGEAEKDSAALITGPADSIVTMDRVFAWATSVLAGKKTHILQLKTIAESMDEKPDYVSKLACAIAFPDRRTEFMKTIDEIPERNGMVLKVVLWTYLAIAEFEAGNLDNCIKLLEQIPDSSADSFEFKLSRKLRDRIKTLRED